MNDRYPAIDIMRCQAFAKHHPEWVLIARPGCFLAERVTARGVHVIAELSLGGLLAHLEEITD